MADELPNLYQSPPGSGGNDGALPTTYDPGWQGYVNLTVPQQQAFMSFPQFLSFYAGTRRWLAELSGTTATVTPVGGSPTSIAIGTDDRDKMLIGQIQQAVDKGIAPSPVPFVTGDSTVYLLDATGVAAVYRAVAAFVAQLFAAQAQAISGINGKTITKPSQIDALYAAVAPNSVSSTRPNTF